MSDAADPAPPWIAPELLALARLPLRTTPRTAEAALAYQIAHVQSSGEEPLEHWLRLLRALQRLAQLAQSDPSAWEQHVRCLWPAAASKLIAKRQRAIPRACANVVGLVVTVFSADNIEKWTHLQHETIRDGSAEKQIPVGFDLQYAGANLGAVLAAIVAVATPPLPDEQTAFRVASVSNVARDVSDAQWLERLADLADRGVAIFDIPCLDLRVTKQNASQIVNSLHRLFGKPRSASHANVHRATLTYHPYEPIEAMLISAIGDGSSVREVIARFSRLNARRHVAVGPSLAQWLAFALFSRESRHKIRRFVFGPTPQNLFSHEQVREVLEADDPVAALFPQFTDSIVQNANMRLAASEFVLFDPADDDDTTSVHRKLTDHPHEGLRILSETPECWSVVLPAWGRAWVSKADAVVTTTESLASGNRRHIPDIAITAYTSEELAQSLSWLKLVGSGTKVVSLACNTLSIRSFAWEQAGVTPSPVLLDWSDIRTAFPNVKKLRLSHLQLDSLRTSADWISAADCHLHHLRLFNVSVREEDAGLPAFLDMLSDNHHPAATKIRSVVVVATNPGQPQNEIVAAALRMLTTNRYLRSFLLHLKPPGDETADLVDYAEIKAAFAAHNNTPLYTYLRKRLAVLSAVGQTSGRLLLGLDCSVLGDIFHFAGLCRRRSVEVHVYGL